MQATNEDKALEILRLIFSGRLDKENSKAVKQVADIIGRKYSDTTQAEKFTAAQAAVKAFIVKHGNILFLGEGTKAEKLKQKFYSLQDAASDAYWTDEMDAAVRGGL